jgi:hypothetical protein
MKKIKQKEASESVFTLDDLIQESIEMNNFIKKRINNQIINSPPLNKFFSQKIFLHNSSKINFWERNISTSNVSIIYIT